MAAATRNTDPPPSPPPPPPSLIYTRGRRLYVPRSSLSDKLPFDWPTAIRYEQISYVNPIRPFPSPLLRRVFQNVNVFSIAKESLRKNRFGNKSLLFSRSLFLSLSIYIYIYISPSLYKIRPSKWFPVIRRRAQSEGISTTATSADPSRSNFSARPDRLCSEAARQSGLAFHKVLAS